MALRLTRREMGTTAVAGSCEQARERQSQSQSTSGGRGKGGKDAFACQQ